MAPTRFRPVTRALALAALGLALLLPSAAACAGLGSAPTDQGPWDEKLLVFAKANTETQGPFLSLDKSVSTTARYRGGTETSGITSTVGAIQSQAPPVVEFLLSEPLSKTYYLNVTKYVIGTIHWQSSTTSAGSRDLGRMRFEFYTGTTLVGGFSVNCNLAQTHSAYIPLHFRFRAETSTLNQGDVLKLRVVRLTGLSDFYIGTDGTRQSFIEFRYFTHNPLSSGLYVERATGEAKKPPALEKGEAAPDPSLALLGAAPLVGLAALGVGRRGRPMLAVLVLTGVAFAGCLAPEEPNRLQLAPDDAPTPTPSAEQTFVEDKELEKVERGAILGMVRDGDKANTPVPGAHVALLGTIHFMDTPANGSFHFPNLVPNLYELRVDMPNFPSYQGTVEVVVGKVSIVNVTLRRAVQATSNTVAHTHDDWAGSIVETIFEGNVLPGSYGANLPDNYQNIWYCGACEARLIVPHGKRVLPGTTRIEVTLTWTQTAVAPKEFELLVRGPETGFLPPWMMGRGTAVPYNVAIFPREADPGHQLFTRWEFVIRPLKTEIGYTLGPWIESGGKVHAVIKVHKGVVPLEPPHTDRWGEKTEIVLLNEARLVNGCQGCNYPNEHTPGFALYWWLQSGAYVPAGTKEVYGYLRWQNNPDAAGAAWRLSYKPSNVPPNEAKYFLIPWAGAGSGPNNQTFKFPVPKDHVDQYYQPASYWRFFPDDGDAVNNGAPLIITSTPSVTFWLTAVAVKDPTYRFE